MADLATSVDAPPSGASLLDKKMKKMPGWISGAIVLVALVGGLGLHRLPRRRRPGQHPLGSVWPYILLGVALCHRPGI